MIRINTLDRCGETLTIELMGYINRRELDIIYDFLQSQVEEGVREVCIEASEMRSFNPLLRQDVSRFGQLGLRLRFRQLTPLIRTGLELWGLEDWIDD